MSDATVTTDTPMNSPEARSPDGTMLDQSPSTTPTPPTPSTDGESFLTEKDSAPPEPKEGEGAIAKPEAPAGAPEKYADFKAPEGYTFDDQTLTAATSLFKEMGLSQEQAQKFVDLYANNALQANEAPYKAWAELQKEWKTEISNRFPGDKSTQVRSDIAKAITSTLSPSLARSLNKALDLTGAGSHPDVVEALSIMLRPLYEGTPVKGNGPAATGQTSKSDQPRSAAEAIYPHLMKNQ